MKYAGTLIRYLMSNYDAVKAHRGNGRHIWPCMDVGTWTLYSGCITRDKLSLDRTSGAYKSGPNTVAEEKNVLLSNILKIIETRILVW